MSSSQLSRSEFSRRTSENHAKLNNRERPEELRGFLKFAVEKQVQQLISRPFAFSYLEPNLNYSIVINEYDRLLKYIEKCRQPGKKQLTSIIFPVFVHLYLLMLQNSADDEEGYENASAFFQKYKGIFLNAKGYENILKELKELKNASDVNQHDYFSKFWKMKYIIKASVDVLQKLKDFLEDEKCKALVYVLHFHLYFEDEDSFTFVADEESKFDNAEKDSRSILTNVDAEEISPSAVSPVDIGYKFPYFCSADFNEKESEICIASHNSSLAMEGATSSCIYLESLDNSSRNVREIKLLGVSAVKYVPGEPNTILASYGMNVKRIDTTTGKDVFKYDTEHVAQIWDVDANASFFVTASKDLKACAWKMNDPVAVKQYMGHNSDVTVVKLHPNGLYFATGSADATIFLWDLEKAIPIRYFIGHCGKITSIAFSPNGEVLASSDTMGVVKLWDIRQCAARFEVEDVKAPGSNLCFNDVNTHFAFCDSTGNFRRWDYRSTNEISNIEFRKTPIVMKFTKRREWKIAFKKN